MREPYIILSLTPALQREVHRYADALEEIHLRLNQKTELVVAGRAFLVNIVSSRNDIRILLEAATNYSLYAAQEYLRDGFITTKDGCRIGIAGTVTRDGNGISAIRNATSLCIRFSKAHPGMADTLIRRLQERSGSVLMIGTPGCGKTSLLRDLIRQISDTMHQRVGVVDERFEICGAAEGVLTMQVGERSDILSGCKKEQGMMMLLRGCAPQWIAVDEITTPEDIDAMDRCAYCGVSLIATAHAASMDDLRRRELYRRLMERKIFTYIAEMKRDHSYAVYKAEELHG